MLSYVDSSAVNMWNDDIKSCVILVESYCLVKESRSICLGYNYRRSNQM